MHVVLWTTFKMYNSNSTPICGSWLVLIKSTEACWNRSKRLSSMYKNYLLNKCTSFRFVCFNKRDNYESRVLDILEKKLIEHIHIFLNQKGCSCNEYLYQTKLIKCRICCLVLVIWLWVNSVRTTHWVKIYIL